MQRTIAALSAAHVGTAATLDSPRGLIDERVEGESAAEPRLLANGAIRYVVPPRTAIFQNKPFFFDDEITRAEADKRGKAVFSTRRVHNLAVGSAGSLDLLYAYRAGTGGSGGSGGGRAARGADRLYFEVHSAQGAFGPERDHFHVLEGILVRADGGVISAGLGGLASSVRVAVREV